MRKLLVILVILSACSSQNWGRKPVRYGAIGAGPTGATSSMVWGASSYVALLDGGPQQTKWTPVENSNTVSLVCTAQDAGAGPALGSVTLLGSNDGVNGIALTASALTFAGSGPSSVGWDPISTGMGYLAVALDGGGTVSGFVGCTLQGKGPVAASN